ncbi:MAG: hypothetical protein CVV42_00705 [Candidatus Riflebacteria bacterium HGW-Riflebacteria-2]|jgi:predicted PurR-regulated permease PerM|nr:MAG: hypothetical protein CVV42_00705 [Candidatus Riflebacteria bacterium HGW-Riflebacteria-2]
MNVESGFDRGFRLLIGAAALLIILQAINQAHSILASVLIAVFFAILGTPPVLWLERKRVPVFIAVILVMLGMFVVLVGLGVFVGAAINNFITELPAYQDRLQIQITVFQAWLAGNGVHGIDKVLLGIANPSALMGLTANLVSRLWSALSDIILILFIVALILLEVSGFPAKLRAVLGDPRQVFPQFTKFIGEMERYVVVHTIFSLLTGLLVGLWLTLIDVDFAILWGFLAFLFNYVPNVGSIVAVIPVSLIALVQFGIEGALLATGGCVAINIILGNIVETMVTGKKFGLSTLVVFLSLVFWGNLLGPVGMVLCIPLTMTIKFACENNSDTLWLAVFLGPEAIPGQDNFIDSQKKKAAAE